MTTIPFVIDNQQHRMSDVLNTLLTQHHQGCSLDIAAAYFNVGGWQLPLYLSANPSTPSPSSPHYETLSQFWL